MLLVQSLRFAYGESGFTLHVEEFRARAGERIALIGPSGSGKTTFLHLLAGIRESLSGTITIDDQSFAKWHPAARRRYRLERIGLVFQEFELIEYLTVLDNILIACRLDRAVRMTSERRARAAQLAEEVGLGDKLRRFPGALSQGEKQRVSICRALLNEPPLILADEPTGNLDPANKQRVLELLVAYAQQSGATLIAATHDHQFLDRFDRVIDAQPWSEQVVVSGAGHDR